MPQFSDDLFLGAAQTYMGINTFSALGDPSPMDLGVGPLGRIYVWDSVPLTLQTNNIATASVYTAAIALTAGTGTTSVVRADGVSVVQLDVPRAVSVRTGAGTPTTRNVTVVGYDYYGEAMSEVIVTGTVASTTTNGKKAFFQIVSASISGSAVVTIAVGTTDILGFPVRMNSGVYISHVGWSTGFTLDTGTFVAAVTTTATTTTGDIRGTFLPSSAADGAKRLVIGALLTGLAVGPNATRAGALGVTQA